MTDKSMQAYEDQVKREMIYEISHDIIKLIMENMKNHGPDPESMILVAGGLVHTIKTLKAITPNFDTIVAKLLVNEDMDNIFGEKK